ncbi:MAG: RpiB/LacA/LacB family sugar-phosphate isomerase [Patescibacteria group bacterium]
MKPTIYIGADHAGFDMKATIKEHFESRDYIVEDLGALELDPTDDYPQYAEAVAQAVLKHPGSLGVLSCGNAEGVCIAANKFDDIRAGLGFSIEAARTMRNDDNANVICIPGRIETKDDPLEIVEAFLETSFSGAERHLRRLSQLDDIEQLHQHSTTVVPAVLTYAEDDFVSRMSDPEVRKLASLYQIDILDGSMFDETCYHDPLAMSHIKLPPKVELHLMINDPLPVVEEWQRRVPTLERAIIHAEISKMLLPVIEGIKNLGLEVGLALNPETDLETVERLLPTLNMLLIMGVNPGKSGQKFLGDDILKKIETARKSFPSLKIAVDGGITLENASEIVKVGANQLCVSSVIWQAENKIQAFTQLLRAGI